MTTNNTPSKNTEPATPNPELKDDIILRLKSHFANEIWLDRAILLLQHFRSGSSSDMSPEIKMSDIKGLNKYEIETIIERLYLACDYNVIIQVTTGEENVIWDNKKTVTITPILSSPHIIKKEKKELLPFNKELLPFNSVFGQSKSTADLVLSDLYFIRQERNRSKFIEIRTDGSVSIKKEVAEQYPGIALRDFDKSEQWSLHNYNKNEDLPLGKSDSVQYKLAKYVLEYSGISCTIDSVISYTNTDKTKSIIKTQKNTELSTDRKNLIKTRVDSFNSNLKTYTNTNGKPIISMTSDGVEKITLTLN